MNKRLKHPGVFWGLAAAGLLLVFGLGFIRGAAAADPSAAQTPVPGREEAQMASLREALQSGKLSPDAESSVQEKLEMAERMAEQQSAPRATRSTKMPPSMPPAVIEPEAGPEVFVDEIFEGSEALVRPSQANILNGFQGQRGDKLLQVLAGSLPDDASQGLLIVFEISLDRPKRTGNTYLSPVPNGVLRITAVDENQITLTTESGTELFFDLTTRTFLQQ